MNVLSPGRRDAGARGRQLRRALGKHRQGARNGRPHAEGGLGRGGRAGGGGRGARRRSRDPRGVRAALRVVAPAPRTTSKAIAAGRRAHGRTRCSWSTPSRARAPWRSRPQAWGVDVVVVGSQKALALPPGLAFLALSARAWERVDARRAALLFRPPARAQGAGRRRVGVHARHLATWSRCGPRSSFVEAMGGVDALVENAATLAAIDARGRGGARRCRCVAPRAPRRCADGAAIRRRGSNRGRS